MVLYTFMRRVLSPVALYLLTLVLASQLTAAETRSDSTQHQNYALQIEGGLISLQATDVPLIQIIEDIGAQMDIEVVIQIPKDEQVTARFEALPLEKALQRLSQNHALMTDKEAGTISKIFLLPKGQEAKMGRADVLSREPVSVGVKTLRTSEDHSSEQSTHTKQPKPFEFTFDPSQFESNAPR